MPSFRDFTFPSCNGKNNVYVRQHTPDGVPRGVVQIAHGIAEHVERYDAFAAFLAENGFVVVANDHLGHGRTVRDSSELGFFGETGGWELVVGDMHTLHDMTAEHHQGLPYFLFGHSMGSFLSRTYIIRYRTGLDGVILCGTGQQSPILVNGGKLVSSIEIKKHGPAYRSQNLQNMAFGRYNDGFAPARTISDWISRDEAVVDRYNEDPLCGFLPSAGLFRDMMGGISYIQAQKNVNRMKKDLPVYFISGDADPVGENGAGVMRAYKSFLKAGMTDVTMKLYHDCRHELLNELNRDEVMEDILVWLESKLK
jgi:alpha-beta hydrolase superfamily lysophospholipase